MVVGFFADWCPACKNFYPIFQEHKREAEQRHGRGLPIFTMDASSYPRAQRVPHVEVFVDGQPQVLKGAQNESLLQQVFDLVAKEGASQPPLPRRRPTLEDLVRLRDF